MKTVAALFILLIATGGSWMYQMNKSNIIKNDSHPETTQTASKVSNATTTPTTTSVASTASTSVKAVVTTKVAQATTTNKQSSSLSQKTTSVSAPNSQPAVSVTANIPAPVKNIYNNSTYKFSMEIPSGWKGEAEANSNSQIGGVNFKDSSGQITPSDLAMSVGATDRKLQDQKYLEAYGKVPSNKDLLDMFVASQKDTGWEFQSTIPATLNNVSGYLLTATYADGYATSKKYLLFSGDFIYTVGVDFPTSALNTTYSKYKTYIQTFKSN